jgi:hypothetical protein
LILFFCKFEENAPYFLRSLSFVKPSGSSDLVFLPCMQISMNSADTLPVSGQRSLPFFFCSICPLPGTGVHFSLSVTPLLRHAPGSSAVLRFRTTLISARMVDPAGLEPATPALSRRCSNQLSYGSACAGSLGFSRLACGRRVCFLPAFVVPALLSPFLLPSLHVAMQRKRRWWRQGDSNS